MTAKLTSKQEIFINEYLKCWNATEAARLAGYKGNDNVLGVTGYDNLRNPKISKAIEVRLQESAMSAEEALMHLAELARQQIGPAFFFKKEKVNAFSEKGFAVEVERLGLDWDKLNEYAHLVKSISFTANGPRIEMYDRLKPLELIGRNQGIFNDPGSSVDKPLIVKVVKGVSTDDI